jgi:hypothetical protein
LLVRVNSIDQGRCEAKHFAFVTLTYPAAFPTAQASKKDLDAFLKRLERSYGQLWVIWKLEPQRRGAPHFHLLVYLGSTFHADDLCTWAAHAWHELAGGGDPNHLKWHLGQLGNRRCVETVRDWQGVANYAGKYLGKVSIGDEEWKHPGRFWGERRDELAPITIITQDVEVRQAVQVKRICIRWYEKQLTGWYYMAGKKTTRGKHRPGVRVHGREIAPGRQVSKLTAVHLADLAETIERQIRPQRRRWKGRQGGFSGFMPVEMFTRLLTWSATECSLDPSLEEGSGSTAIAQGDRFDRRRRSISVRHARGTPVKPQLRGQVEPLA